MIILWAILIKGYVEVADDIFELWGGYMNSWKPEGQSITKAIVRVEGGNVNKGHLAKRIIQPTR